VGGLNTQQMKKRCYVHLELWILDIRYTKEGGATCSRPKKKRYTYLEL
jgi:hypothetical protein